MKTKLLTLFCSFAAVGAFAANTWYADANAENDSGDGTSPETARKHIQSLIDDTAVKNGDTIILKPGLYNDGYATDNNSYKARVYVNKKLTIKGMEGKRDETFVTGEKKEDSTSGVGSGAMRAFSVNAENVIIEGITICGGYGPGTANGTFGGGVSFKNNTNNWIIDCVVSNCVAQRGGATALGIAIRCLFTKNSSLAYGLVASQTKMLNCLVVRNSGEQFLFVNPALMVNFTIADNPASGCGVFPSGGNQRLYNSIITENGFTKLGNNSSNAAVLSNCLITAGMANYSKAEAAKTCNTNAPACGFCAPALGDWHPTAASGAVERGDSAHLSLIEVPSGRSSLRYTDYAGNAISETGSICAGAIQETAGVGGALKSDVLYECDGADWAGWYIGTYGSYAHATNWPAMFKVRKSGVNRTAVVWYEDASGRVYIPDTNGWIGVILPPAESTLLSLKACATYKTLFVDAENGDDSYEGTDIGTSSHPYKTIQAAVDAAPAGSGTSTIRYDMIRVRRGTYTVSSGSVIDIPSGISYRRLRIFAEDGPEHTIIDGQNARKCLSIYNPAVVQGFTLTRGYTSASDEGGVLQTNGNVLSRYLADCIITNNTGISVVQRGGMAIRCKFSDNSGMQISNGGAVGCIIKAAGYAFGGTEGKIYFCTIETSTTKTDDSDFYYGGCLFKGMGSLSFTGPAVGCFGHNTTIGGAGASGCSTGKAKFIGGDRDYRFYASSGAVGAVGFDSLDGFWQYAMLDLDGNTMFKTNDGITAGARQWPSIWQDPGFVFYIW